MFDQTLWYSLGQKWKSVRELSIYSHTHHWVSLHGSHALPSEGAVWSLVDHAITVLQSSHQAFGNSLPPVSVEAFPSRGALDVAGLFQQELLRLPQSVTDVSFQLMGWWLPLVCSANTDFCTDWVRHASRCSLSLVSSLRVVLPM